MSLKDRITEDMKSAMRARDAARLLAIRGLLAAVKQREVDERVVLDDAAVVAVIDKLVKQRNDSIAQFGGAGRTDLVDKESAEKAVLESYLPRRLDAVAIEAEVATLAAGLEADLGRPVGPSDMGRLMAAAKTRLAGNAEMALVSAAVKKALAR
jgi:uncharacterized protein YqeY